MKTASPRSSTSRAAQAATGAGLRRQASMRDAERPCPGRALCGTAGLPVRSSPDARSAAVAFRAPVGMNLMVAL